MLEQAGYPPEQPSTSRSFFLLGIAPPSLGRLGRDVAHTLPYRHLLFVGWVLAIKVCFLTDVFVTVNYKYRRIGCVVLRMGTDGYGWVRKICKQKFPMYVRKRVFGTPVYVEMMLFILVNYLNPITAPYTSVHIRTYPYSHRPIPA